MDTAVSGKKCANMVKNIKEKEGISVTFQRFSPLNWKRRRIMDFHIKPLYAQQLALFRRSAVEK